MARIPISIDPVWGWALLLTGTTQKRCYVEFGEQSLHLRFGPARVSVPYDNICGAERLDWPWGQLGVRHGPGGAVGLIGSTDRVVKLCLRRPVEVETWPFNLHDSHLALSVPDPEAFVRQVCERAEIAEQESQDRGEVARAERRRRRSVATEATEPPKPALDERVFTATLYPRMGVAFLWLSVKLGLMAAFVAALFAATQPILALPAMACLAVLMALLFGGRAHLTRMRLSVGKDGVFMERRGDSRYVPFVDIADAVEIDEAVLRLILHSGEIVDIDTGKAGSMRSAYRQRCEKLLAHINEGIDRAEKHLQRDPAAQEATALCDRAQVLLRRRERTKRVAYRTMPALTADQLWEVLDNTAASPAERGAAAVMLRHQQGQQAAPRLRIAAEQTVNPKLRRLLRVAVDETDEQVSEALAELEAAAHHEQERTRAALATE